MLLVKETIEIYGYDPSLFTHGSKKKVVCSCYKCGNLRHVEFSWRDAMCKSCKSSLILKNLNEKRKAQGLPSIGRPLGKDKEKRKAYMREWRRNERNTLRG